MVKFKAACVSDMERYLAIIHSWMTSNLLKLNADKTETLLVSRNVKPCPVPPLCINFNGEKIMPSKQVRNLGVIFDSKFSLEAHVNNLCQASYLQLYNISQVRKCLSKAACESLIHAFISSRLDSMNAILHGLPDYLIEKLQKVQNHAARVLCGLRKHDHITPALQALHWLPIRKRIEYKMAMLCYKCIHMLAPKYLCDMISIYTPRISWGLPFTNTCWMYQRSELVLVSELLVTAVQRFGMIYLMMCVHQNLWILLNKSLKPTFLNLRI